MTGGRDRMNKIIENWLGKGEETIVEYEISSDQNQSLDVEYDNILKATSSKYSSSIFAETDTSVIKADKLDCLIAVSSGLLTGMLDVFWVGEFSLTDAQSKGRELTNQFVLKVAQSQGYKKDTLEEAIKFLEKKFPNPSDKVASDYGSGKQHHLRDFSHHPTPFGLICSILTQFTSMGHGTGTDGRYLEVEILNSDAIGSTFEEKILFGIVIWAFHLVSDMAGSSQRAGAGTGIPGPLLSTLKEASTLPLIRDIKVHYKEDEIPLSQWISKLFNGTACPHENQHDLVRFDLRTEIGIKGYEIKQAIPNIINQCIVRSFYFIRRLIVEVKNKNIKSIKELKNLETRNFLPWNNRCIARMLTISTGMFAVVDTSDATIRAIMRNPHAKVAFVKDFLFRVNFYGIASFTVAIRNDAQYIKSDVKDAFTIKAKKVLAEQEAMNIDQSIEVEVVMDNSNIYEYVFESLYKTVKENKKQSSERYGIVKYMAPQIFDVGDDNFNLYKDIVSWNEYATVHETERLVVRMFEQNNVPYVPAIQPFAFTREEDGKKIGYIFSLETTPKLESEMLMEMGVDGVKVISLINPQGYLDTLETIVREEEKKYRGFVKFMVLEDLFALFGADEFSKYMEYAEDYNERVRNLIGYNTVIMTSDEVVRKFREDKSVMLGEYSYQQLLPSRIYKEQADKLTHNFIDRGLYRAITRNANFADSFISSEWYYSIHKATGSLEQTAIVAGYLKSIEQLLYAIIHLSIDRGKEIKKKWSKELIAYTTENETLIDSTLGALNGFLKRYSDIYDVSRDVMQHITATVNLYRDKYRNDHFHKDNVYANEEIEDIRKQTLYLYFLILGGCTIHDEEFAQLGILSAQAESVEQNEVPQYLDFETWLNLILSFDQLKGVPVIYFDFNRNHNENRYLLQLATTSKFEENGYKWTSDISFPFVNDAFGWRSECSKEGAQVQIVDLLKRYLKSGRMACELKEHDFVVIGHLSHVECVYKKLN